MSQSNVIFGFLFAAFVVFITQRGELPVYLGFILATPQGGGNSPSTASATPAANTLIQSAIALPTGI